MTGKRTINARIIFAACFCALMTVLGLSAIFACAERHLERRSTEIFFKADVPVVRTFRDLYPFDDGADGVETPEGQSLLSFILAYRNAFCRKRSSIKWYSANRNFLLKYFHRFCIWKESPGTFLIENGDFPIVRLPNGYLTGVYFQPRESWRTVRKWNIWLKKRNIPLLQLLPSSKMDDSVTIFPPGISRGYAGMMDRYKTFLLKNRIPYLDAKDVLLNANRDFYSWFYKTDHHWNVFAGRLIAEATAKKLNDEFGIATDVDAVKEVHFKLIRYPSIFMGSMAIRAGDPPEDFEVFYQRKKGRFHLKIPSLGIDRVGGFNDTLIVQPYLKLPGMYGCFLCSDKPLIQIENKNCTNGTRVLVVSHSQANVVCPYLACAVQYLDIVDPRYFDGSIKSFIEQTKPDIVLTCF